jgi:hypothetical protein
MIPSPKNLMRIIRRRLIKKMLKGSQPGNKLKRNGVSMNPLTIKMKNTETLQDMTMMKILKISTNF